MISVDPAAQATWLPRKESSPLQSAASCRNKRHGSPLQAGKQASKRPNKRVFNSNALFKAELGTIFSPNQVKELKEQKLRRKS